MKLTVTSLSLALLLCVSGCGASPDSLIQDQIKSINDMATAMESKAPEAKLTEIKTRMEATNKALDALKLSDDAKKQLLEKHKAAFTEATGRFMKAAMAAGGADIGKFMPGGPNVAPKNDK